MTDPERATAAPVPRTNPMRGRVVAAGEGQASAGNLANIITVVRILLAPAFVAMLLVDAGSLGPLRYAAGILFVLAIATDFADGLLARRRNLVTDAGKILDPIADKVLTGSALVGLSILAELPWVVTALILAREIGITVWRFVALRDRVIPAGILGKVKTWAQAIALSFALIPLWPLAGEAARPVNDAVNTGMMAVALALTLVSGAEYAWHALRARPAAG